MVQIIVNGTPETVSVCSIAELVIQKGLRTEALVIEWNRQILKQEEWPFIQLQEQDQLELLQFVGGG
ncbi:sulfur carrier protein ThiS [Desulfobulbus oligotrophicus]|jgi:sulfur carrier protein|uniref:Sulfur carrier protein ThiS n=1 Tax=Desulfobulbus oligotrophicus TaxID=1909699 RepID=A0A7T5VEG8_9BACT|nr:sulfur carrier protein ThiS [Desulfobulbus oligotrophicus]MDY0391734.1 sulfur carrier protein ThiS [Desulfobulbus oligotrophicus]QQG66402.1 sulfur carrier protein ThiS [Desulfobulbus oligotrophicus]